MITSEKHLLYILGVNKEQLDYLLAHIEDYYYSFERVKLNKFTGKPKRIVMEKLQLDKLIHLKEN